MASEYSYRSLLGIPFVWRGRDPAVGLDCYGLIKVHLKLKRGYLIPEENATSAGEARERIGLVDLDLWEPVRGALEADNVLTFADGCGHEGASHVAIYLGDGKVLHTSERTGVIVTPLRVMRQRFREAYRWRAA